MQCLFSAHSIDPIFMCINICSRHVEYKQLINNNSIGMDKQLIHPRSAKTKIVQRVVHFSGQEIMKI